MALYEQSKHATNLEEWYTNIELHTGMWKSQVVNDLFYILHSNDMQKARNSYEIMESGDVNQEPREKRVV